MTDASYRTDLSGAILRLKENGMMHELQTRWWKEKRGGDKCSVRNARRRRPSVCIAVVCRRGKNYADYVAGYVIPPTASRHLDSRVITNASAFYHPS